MEKEYILAAVCLAQRYATSVRMSLSSRDSAGAVRSCMYAASTNVYCDVT
jgi:hypothetical protein